MSIVGRMTLDTAWFHMAHYSVSVSAGCLITPFIRLSLQFGALSMARGLLSINSFAYFSLFFFSCILKTFYRIKQFWFFLNHHLQMFHTTLLIVHQNTHVLDCRYFGHQNGNIPVIGCILEINQFNILKKVKKKIDSCVMKT